MTRCIGQSCCSDRANHQAEGHECEPREVRDSAYLCGSCRSRLERFLAELPSLHDDLGESLTTARRRRRGGGSGRDQAQATGLALEPIVMKAREHVWAWLWGWCRVVAEERGVSLPLSDAVDTLAHWLGRHVDWLAHQPFADEVLANLEETHSEARRARQIVPPRRFPLRTPDDLPVRCDKPAEGPWLPGAMRGPVCLGFVEAVLRDDTPLLPSELTCSGDPSHRWAPHEWPALGRKVNPGMNRSAMRVLAKAIGA